MKVLKMVRVRNKLVYFVSHVGRLLSRMFRRDFHFCYFEGCEFDPAIGREVVLFASLWR